MVAIRRTPRLPRSAGVDQISCQPCGCLVDGPLLTRSTRPGVWKEVLTRGPRALSSHGAGQLHGERRMKRLGLQGARRRRSVRTTAPRTSVPCQLDRVHRVVQAELIHRRIPWKTRESVELATLQGCTCSTRPDRSSRFGASPCRGWGKLVAATRQ